LPFTGKRLKSLGNPLKSGGCRRVYRKVIARVANWESYRLPKLFRCKDVTLIGESRARDATDGVRREFPL